MAKRLWERIAAGTEIKLWVDPDSYVKTDVVAERDRLLEILAADDVVRQELADCGEYPDLQSYDDYIQSQVDALNDLIDTFDYDTKIQELTVHDGAWFSPDSVQSVLSEDIGNEASKSIDGNTNTFFRDSQNHVHEIVYQLRDYPKKISGIRFYYGAGESARERLNDIAVHAANAVPNIDDPGNILETGINLTWTAGGGVWVEHTLASKKNKCKFVKIVIGNTDNGNNQCQIREFEVRVEPKDPEVL